ncbi:MAG TPA: hypothetical protein EYQ31_16105, partial [Candidatus Handelsmanbacteria bacterium]|nr:hypothetical protein [Candidatus Handelsmanbacteria bacterium]
MADSHGDASHHDFSWQGVRLRVPSEWELGRVDGDADSGYARLDDARMVRAEVEAVRSGGRLLCGLPWPTPITLTAPSEVGEALAAGDSVALRSPEGVVVAAVALCGVADHLVAPVVGEVEV